jgi:ribosomal protein L37AE/L43A
MLEHWLIELIGHVSGLQDPLISGGVPSSVQIVDGEAPPVCPACGTQMRHFADFEIYECRECRLFVSEKVRQSDVNDVNNVNTSSLEHSSRVDNAA